MTEQNAKILLLGPGPLDQKMKAFSSTAQALASIPTWQREIGQRVTVVESGVAKLYWFETGIADGDLVLFPVGAGGGGFIPLAGTETGKPVTGDIEFANIDEGGIHSVIESFNDGSSWRWRALDNNGRNAVSPVGLYYIHETNYSYLAVGGNFIQLFSENPLYRGIEADQYFGANYNPNTYVQKKYVDDKVVSAHATLTIEDDETTWNTTTGLNKKLTSEIGVNGDFTLIITNLINGMSGALTIECLDPVTITLNTGTIAAKGNGSLTLAEGYYVFAFVYDGSLLFWNIANYA
jgi:hypothetical protein